MRLDDDSLADREFDDELQQFFRNEDDCRIRQRKNLGDLAALEYLDENGKWKLMGFVKEDGDWKMTVPDSKISAIMDAPR